MINFLKNVSNILRKYLHLIEELVMVLSLIIIFVFVTIQVILRYAFDSGIMWALELVGFLFVLMGMIGMAIAIKEKMHINLNILVEKAPRALAKIMKITSDLVVLSFLFILFISGMIFANGVKAQTAVMLNIPMRIVYFIIPLGAVLMIIRFIELKFIKNKE